MNEPHSKHDETLIELLRNDLPGPHQMLGKLGDEGRGIGGVGTGGTGAKAFFVALVLTPALIMLLLLVVGVIIKEVELREEHYATHRELVFGGIDVGYPMIMPKSNIDIYVKYDTDTGISWSCANCVEDHMRLALQNAKRVMPADLSVDETGVRLGGDRYREGRTDWWPAELSERLMRKGLPPDYDVFSVVEEMSHKYKYYIFVTPKPCRVYHYSPGEISD